MMTGVTKRPLLAQGLLYFLELTSRVLEDRERVKGMGFWFSFLIILNLKCGYFRHPSL